MKRILIILVLIAVNTYGQITFTDVNFKNALLQHSNPVIDVNRNGEIEMSEAEAVTSLVISGKGITNLTEISYFINIISLDCSSNNLTLLNLDNNLLLKDLNANHNELNTIDLTKNVDLEKLRLANNDIEAINLTENSKLELFALSNSSITNIDLSDNPLLNALSISQCDQISTLNLSINTALESLYLIECKLISELNLDANIALENLNITSSSLLDLSLVNNINLKTLIGISTSLQSLNVKNGNNTKIQYFNLQGNPNLHCIEVDNAVYSTTNWTNIDNLTTIFSESCTTASVKDDLLTNFSIYPNPVQNNLQVQTSESIQTLTIYNVLGEQLLKTTAQNTITTTSLPKGVYILKVATESGKIGTQKFIKK